MTSALTPDESLWHDDLLERRHIAEYLTGYLIRRHQVKPDEKGFVLAINAEWGYGKTYLLKRWASEVEKIYPTVYFDAWQNDFTPEPLVAFIAELDSSLAEYFKKIPVTTTASKKAKEKAKLLWKGAKAALIPLLAKKAFNMTVTELNDIVEISSATESEGTPLVTSQELQDAIAKVFASTLTKHTNIKSAITDFRAKLEMLIDALSNSDDAQLPIFIFVDELDRCRPNYAIELLEGIKHLFGVRSIYFVVATNIDQLSESVKAVYGSGFNGQQYLKRFFDMEYSLPAPRNTAFAISLFESMYVIPLERAEIGALLDMNTYGSHRLAFVFSVYADFFSATLRDQQQVSKIIEAAFLQLQGIVHIHFAYFLAFVYHKSPSVFDALKRNPSLDNQEYRKLIGTRRQGSGSFYTQERNVGDHSYHKRLSDINAINTVYLTNFNSTPRQIHDNSRNDHSFPNSLLHSISDVFMGANSGAQTILKQYFEVIQHAGGFSEARTNDKS